MTSSQADRVLSKGYFEKKEVMNIEYVIVNLFY